MKRKIAIITAKNNDFYANGLSRFFDAAAKKFGQEFVCTRVTLPDRNEPNDSLYEICSCADALFVVGEVFDEQYPHYEKAVDDLKKRLGLYAEIRRTVVSPDANRKELDITTVKDCAGGIYRGCRGTRKGKLGRESFDTECYSEIEIERTARIAFEIAETNGKALIGIDKADRLESSRLWRYALHEVAADYPFVPLRDLTVNEAATELINHPDSFDILVTNNFFGDFIDGVIAGIAGNNGVVSVACKNDTLPGLYGKLRKKDFYKNDYDCLDDIFSVATAFDLSFGLDTEAAEIETVVKELFFEKEHGFDAVIARLSAKH